MPILIWDNNFLGCDLYWREYGIRTGLQLISFWFSFYDRESFGSFEIAAKYHPNLNQEASEYIWNELNAENYYWKYINVQVEA